MGRKMGFIIGFGAGYVLGARAGRQRYEDIVRWWNQLTGNPTVQRAAGRTKDMASEGARRGLSVVQQGVEKAGTAVRDRLHKEEPTDTMVDLTRKQSGKSPRENPSTASEGLASPARDDLGT
ncbi:MAG: hypothetical protein E6G44_07435 [Actinobacteria bacterium]|nr:MAG: hypothetical protein E6G44_07435 [Actinomycetota bacterium]